MRVGLLWQSISSGNLGVAALTVSNVAIVRQVAEQLGQDIELTIIGMRDQTGPVLDLGPLSVFVIDSRSIVSPTGYWRLLRDLDVVVDIGAGDSFAEIYGAKRFFYLWYTKFLAILRGIPLVFAPQTLGPFTRFPYRQLAAYTLRKARSVVVRDALSEQCARDLVPGSKPVLATDVAFLLPFDSRANERGKGPLRVGVNVSGLMYNEAETGRNRFGLSFDYADYSRRLLANLIAREDVEVHLVAHANSHADGNDDDGRFADRISSEFPGLIRVPDFNGPSDAKGYISGLDFLVAGRMHACIAAYSSGVPVIPVAYSRKFAGLFGSLGYQWTLPATGLTTDQALAHTLDALERRAELASDIERGNMLVRERLDGYRAILRDCFKQAASQIR